MVVVVVSIGVGVEVEVEVGVAMTDIDPDIVARTVAFMDRLRSNMEKHKSILGRLTDSPTTQLPPWHLRDDEGRVFRVIPHGSWLTAHHPDGSIRCNHGDRVYCDIDHKTEITYQLTPVESEADDE